MPTGWPTSLPIRGWVCRAPRDLSEGCDGVLVTPHVVGRRALVEPAPSWARPRTPRVHWYDGRDGPCGDPGRGRGLGSARGSKRQEVKTAHQQYRQAKFVVVHNAADVDDRITS